MAIIDFYDRGWGINPGVAYIQGDRSYTFNEVGALLPYRQSSAGAGLAQGRPKAPSGPVTMSPPDLYPGAVAREYDLDTGQCPQLG